MKGELKSRPVLLAAIAVLLVSCIGDDPAEPPSSRLGPVSYSTVDNVILLPTFDGCCGIASGVNDNGVIVGSAQSPSSVRAFKFLGGEFINLLENVGLSSSANDVNVRGVIVGSVNQSGTLLTAFRYGHLNTNTLELLEKPLGSSAAANAVSDLGVTVGWYVPINGFLRTAALWDASSAATFTSLGTLGGENSEALDINHSETVVGYSTTAIPGQFLAFKWKESTGMQPLPLLPGATSARAFAINEAGQIAGRMNVAGENHVVVWEIDGTVRDIGVFPGSGSTEPHDINDSGQIVGWDISTNQGFVWDSIDGWRGLGSPSKAHAINNSGLVVGEAGMLNRAAFWQVRPDSARVVIESVSGSMEVRPARTSGRDSVRLRFSVLSNSGQRFSNRAITLTISAVPLSGGHSHTAGVRPAGILRSSSITTDSTGFATVVYKSPEFAGLVTIKAVSTGAKQALDTITVRIQGLQRLNARPSQSQIGTHDEHPSSHWGVPGFLDDIGIFSDSLAAQARRSALRTDSLVIPRDKRIISTDSVFRFPRILAVNDMSLEWGGKFDWKGLATWNGPHDEHRFGRNADIDIRGRATACDTIPGTPRCLSQKADSLRDELYFEKARHIWESVLKHTINDERRVRNHVHLRY